MSSRYGTICSTQISNNFPRTKSLPVSSSSNLKHHLHAWKTCSIEILFTVLVIAWLTWSTTCSLSSSPNFAGHVLREAGLLLLIPRAQLTLQGLCCVVLRPGNWIDFIPRSNKECGSPCKSIFLTPHPRRSCDQSRSLMFALGKNTSFMKHLEHSSSLHLETTYLIWNTWSTVTSLESSIFIDPA